MTHLFVILIGKDPIAFRMKLLKRAREKPVGKNNEYEKTNAIITTFKDETEKVI